MSELKEGHPHGKMRRKEREITDRVEIDSIIRSANLMHIALVDRDMPFLVPVFFWFRWHGSLFSFLKSGHKNRNYKT